MPKSIAIVGASNDRRKYGNKAVRAFKEGGWTVYPVNPKGGAIEGLPVYRDMTETPDPIDRVAMYVPPEIGKEMLDAIAAKQPAEFFLNPGSEDEELMERARAKGLNPINACSIVNIGLSPAQYPSA
ncbi:MAG: CoA-binding protein [Candidatus Hydrogenedentota bacterium]